MKYTSYLFFLLLSLGCIATGANPLSRDARDRSEPVLGPEPRLQQVAFTVNDLPRSIRFYRDVLGLPMLMETNGMAFFDLGSVRLMIGADKLRPTVERATAIIYFDTDEFNATVARLQANGIELAAPVETVTETTTGTLMLAEFGDPDGNALAVMGEVPRLSSDAGDDR